MTDLSLNGTNILQLAPDLPIFNLSILDLYNPAQHEAFVTQGIYMHCVQQSN